MQVERKRKLEEMQTAEKRLHEKLQVLKDEERAAHETMERALGYVHQGGKESSVWMKTDDIMEEEAGHRLLEFGQEKQNEAKKGCVTLVRKESKLRVNYSLNVSKCYITTLFNIS